MTKSKPKAKLPFVSLELITWLEETFPDKCPSENTPDRKVWIQAGAASVVRKLRKIHEEQQENTKGVSL